MALEWMDRAIEQGGPPAGRMLARKVTLMPEQFEEVRDRVMVFLESWRAEGASTRLAFAETLCQGPRTPAATTLARAAVRTIARDSGRFGARMSPAQFRQLVSFAEDGALRADAPALPLSTARPGSRATRPGRSRSRPRTSARWRRRTPPSSPTA